MAVVEAFDTLANSLFLSQQFCGNFFIRPVISWSRGPWGKGGTGNDHKDMVARTTMCMRMGQDTNEARQQHNNVQYSM